MPGAEKLTSACLDDLTTTGTLLTGHTDTTMEPWIVPDPAALRRMHLQPLGRAGFRHGLVAEQISVDLRSHLQRVAPVSEDGRSVRQHHRRSG